MRHEWTWVDQLARFPFGDRSKSPIPVDVWQCRRCGETKNTTTGEEPKTGRCKGMRY